MVMGALADALRARAIAAWRGLVFVLLNTLVVMLLTGLPEQLWGINDAPFLLLLKISLSPLSSALSLKYLGVWLGMSREDRLVKVLLTGGIYGSLVATLVILACYFFAQTVPDKMLILAGAVVNACVVLIVGSVGIRAVLLGDLLARWIVAAAFCFALMVAGLYSKAMGIEHAWPMWLSTAIATVLYFVIVAGVTFLRNKSQQRIRKLALGERPSDEITGLPTGSALLGKIDDAMWRSIRMGRDTAVVAVWMNNLYALSDQAGLHIEHEIRARLTANVRRALGFGSVIGLMQARCFVTAISGVQELSKIEKIATRLLVRVQIPMRVGEFTGDSVTYTPELGIGVVYIPHNRHGDPLLAMDLAQSLAQRACKETSKLLVHEIEAPIGAASSKPVDSIRAG